MHVFWHDDVLRHDTGEGLFDRGPHDLLDVPELHPENAERVRNMRSVLHRGPLASRIRWRDGRHATHEELTTVHEPAYVAGLRERCAGGWGTFEDGVSHYSPDTLDAAPAAERARRAGVERVAIVDWDVHHGNATQACFYERADVLTVSLHMRTGL